MNSTVKQWVIAILAIIAFGYGLMLFGDALGAYTVPFAIVWVAIPVLACFLIRRSALSCFTLAGLRRAQVVLMTVAVAISFAMFACLDDVRNQFGKHFVQGYHYWRGDIDYNDEGRPYYVGDQWAAKTGMGRFVVSLVEWLVFAGVFALPAITLKATREAIYKKEAECVYTVDGKRIETYHTNA
jgi:hypothetical protein